MIITWEILESCSALLTFNMVFRLHSSLTRDRSSVRCSNLSVICYFLDQWSSSRALFWSLSWKWLQLPIQLQHQLPLSMIAWVLTIYITQITQGSFCEEQDGACGWINSKNGWSRSKTFDIMEAKQQYCHLMDTQLCFEVNLS